MNKHKKHITIRPIGNLHAPTLLNRLMNGRDFINGSKGGSLVTAQVQDALALGATLHYLLLGRAPQPSTATAHGSSPARSAVSVRIARWRGCSVSV